MTEETNKRTSSENSVLGKKDQFLAAKGYFRRLAAPVSATNKRKTIILTIIGALSPLLILWKVIYYVPLNPVGFFISGLFIDFTADYTGRSGHNLIVPIIACAITGALFFYFLARNANIFGWVKIIIIYLTIALLLLASNFMNLGFKYHWNDREYYEYNCKFDPVRGCYSEGWILCTDCIAKYYGIWIKPLKLTVCLKNDRTPGCKLYPYG
jgi:hypothetical protein